MSMPVSLYANSSLGIEASASVIILDPPYFLSVTEGDTVSVPCVSSGETLPSFSRDGMMLNSSQYSLSFVSISTSSAGNYACQVEDTIANFTINVSSIGE